MTLLAAAAGTLVARRAVLLAATAVGTAMQGLAIQVLADPAKVVPRLRRTLRIHA